MPLFRTIGSWTMQRGVDNMGIAVLATTILIALPLILGVGLFYELIRRLDFRRALSERTYWALASVATAMVIVLIALFLLGVV